MGFDAGQRHHRNMVVPLTNEDFEKPTQKRLCLDDMAGTLGILCDGLGMLFAFAEDHTTQ